MENVIYVISSTVSLVLSLIMMAMFARMIISFLPIDESAGIAGFLVLLTEPVIYPVRCIFEKLGIDLAIPFDIPFLVTYILLSVLSMLI